MSSCFSLFPENSKEMDEKTGLKKWSQTPDSRSNSSGGIKRERFQGLSLGDGYFLML